MTVGIVGLGLIGGSFARAYKDAGHRVLAFNRDASILEIAKMSDVVDGTLDESSVGECDLVIIALYPEVTIEWLGKMAPHISKDTLVIDTCGTKRDVCNAGFKIAAEAGFTFVGGHPMAGTQFSGFKHSRATMFKGASMIIVPPTFDSPELFDRVKALLEPASFGKITVTTAEKHDEMIAFTSQMAHVVSSAYIKSPCAREHKGFSAGSYKDLTRVAWLNENMWTELFMENRDNLVRELNSFIDSVAAYRDAMEAGDSDKLRALLAEGRQIKEELEKGVTRT
jgi:prephenate dehydrogenase